MIPLCTCTGGSASTLGLSKQKASKASCKRCGGKPLVDVRGSPSCSMLSTVGLELTSRINSDLTWNKVSKGNRSSSRRARKSVDIVLKTREKVVNKDSKDVVMPVSESEKLGVTVLGCRFSEKAEHVPIKKRRFLFRTPSPPPRSPSPLLEESETIIEREHALGQGFLQNSTVECQLAISEGAASADLGQIVDSEVNIHGKNFVKVNKQCDENEDFSGMSILAAAACSNSLSAYVEDCSGVEESFGCEGSLQRLMNIDSKDKLVSSADISTEGTGSCISPSPGVEGPALLKTDHSSPKDLPLGNMKDCTYLEESALAGCISTRDDANIRAQESSARDDRLHWDLNTVMDEWERPFNCHLKDSAANVADGIFEYENGGKQSDKNKNLEGHEFQRAPEGTNDNTSNENTESSNNHKIDPNVGSGIFVPAKYASRPSASDVDENAPANRESSNTTVNTENLSSHRVVKIDSLHSLPPESGHPTTTILFEENCNATSANAVSSKSMKDCTGDPQTTGNIFFSSQVERPNIPFPNVVLSDMVTCDIRNVLNEFGKDGQRPSELLGDGNAVKNIACLETSQVPILDVRESAACESDEMDYPVSYDANSIAPISGAFPGVQHVAPVDTMVQHFETFIVRDNADTETQAQINDEKPAAVSFGKSMTRLEPSSNLSSVDACRRNQNDVVQGHGEVNREEPRQDGYDSDVSQGDRGIAVGFEKSSDLQVDYDYDSQYEDGELRESSLHAWEEYGYKEDVGCLDYGPENRDTNNLGSENTEVNDFQSRLQSSFWTKIADAGCSREIAIGASSPCLRVQNSDMVDSHDKRSGSGPDQATRNDEDNTRDNVREANPSVDLKTKMSGWDCLPENLKGTSEMVRVRDGSIRKHFTGDQKDRSDAEDTEMKMFRSRVNQSELSRIGRSASHGMFIRRDRLDTQGSSSNYDGANPRSERDFDAVKSFGRGRYYLQRGQGYGHFADFSGSDRGLKRHHSHTYHGPVSFRRFGPEDVASYRARIIEDGVGSSRQATNASSHCLHRSLRRSGSPTDRQETFDMHRDSRATGEMGLNRFVTVGRGRSVRYGSQVSSGGPRGRYHGPVNDFSKLLTRRRSFSPVERRGNPPPHQSSSKSPSRSRSRSPNLWRFPRGRNGAGNLGFRNRSRSPNVRSGARMARVRSPHLQPGIFPYQERGLMSAPRARDSPPPNSRCIGFKQRSSALGGRSPRRIGTRGRRFDMLDSPRKPEPNQYYRSMQPGRFSEVNGDGRGSPRHEGADDHTGKHGHRYGIRPLNRYNVEGPEKRFRHELEDEFLAGHESRAKEDTCTHERPKAYSRDIDNQIGDVPRRSREERGPFLSQQDKKYSRNSKSFGMRESDEDVGPRSRPL